VANTPTSAVLPNARAAETGIERAKQRRAARDASGEVYVDGSIYEGMAACLVRSGRTIAHVVDYADAVAIAAAMATPPASDAAVPAGMVERPFAHCCAEAGGRVEACDCVNPNHGKAWFSTANAAPKVASDAGAGLVRTISRAIHEHLSRRDIMQYLDNEEDCKGLARSVVAALGMSATPTDATDGATGGGEA
jgi:hypothetical protein